MGGQNIFQWLFEVIDRRWSASPEASYVAGLMAGGIGRINAKVCGEADEVCVAAVEGDVTHFVGEVSDLLIHTFVLCVRQEVSLQEICDELDRRFGVSGLTEKRSRARYDQP